MRECRIPEGQQDWQIAIIPQNNQILHAGAISNDAALEFLQNKQMPATPRTPSPFQIAKNKLFVWIPHCVCTSTFDFHKRQGIIAQHEMEVKLLLTRGYFLRVSGKRVKMPLVLVLQPPLRTGSWVFPEHVPLGLSIL